MLSQRETSSVTNILVTKDTREILRQLGTKNQKYDEIIQNLIENSTYKRVLDSSEVWTSKMFFKKKSESWTGAQLHSKTQRLSRRIEVFVSVVVCNHFRFCFFSAFIYNSHILSGAGSIQN